MRKNDKLDRLVRRINKTDPIAHEVLMVSLKNLYDKHIAWSMCKDNIAMCEKFLKAQDEFLKKIEQMKVMAGLPWFAKFEFHPEDLFFLYDKFL